MLKEYKVCVVYDDTYLESQHLEYIVKRIRNSRACSTTDLASLGYMRSCLLKSNTKLNKQMNKVNFKM